MFFRVKFLLFITDRKFCFKYVLLLKCVEKIETVIKLIETIVIFILSARRECFLCMKRSFTPRRRSRQYKPLNAQKHLRARNINNFFFFLPFPFHLTGLSGTFYGRFGFLFSFVVRRGSGVLSPATYAHPLSSPFSGRHNRNITTHNIHGRPSGLGFEPC
jgi:hypothetical protein